MNKLIPEIYLATKNLPLLKYSKPHRQMKPNNIGVLQSDVFEPVKPRKTVGQKAFDKLISLKDKYLGLHYMEPAVLEGLAKQPDGSYDKEMLDFIMDIKNYCKKKSIPADQCISTNILEYIIVDGKINKELKDIVLDLFNNDMINPIGLNSFISHSFVESMPSDRRGAMLGFFKDIQIYSPPNENNDWKSLALLVKSYTKFDKNEEEFSKHIKSVRRIMLSSNTPKETSQYLKNMEKIQSAFTSKSEADDFIFKILDSRFVPTDAVVDLLKEDKDRALSLLSLLINMKLNLIKLDEYAISNVFGDTNSKIFRYLIANFPKDKNNILVMESDKFHSNQYRILLGKRELLFDKLTEKLLAQSCITKKPFSDINIQDYQQYSSIHASYDLINNYGALKNKYIINNLNEKTYIQQAVENGQLDVFRLNKNNKIDILSRGVFNPQTGECVVKQNFESPSGVKTKIKFLQRKNGNYTYKYCITDKNGKSLADINRTYKVIDENNFVSTFNGKVYHISVSNNIIQVKSDDKIVTVDLNKLVPSNDQKIIDMIVHLPGDEIIKIKESYLIRVETESYEPDSAVLIDGIIKLGEDCKQNPIAFLHELGHHKESLLNEDEWNDIISVYKKELDEYKAKTTSFELDMVSYIIDNDDHYLAEERGAISEVFADINSITKLPNNSRCLAERIVVLQENFPRTIAEILKYI